MQKMESAVLYNSYNKGKLKKVQIEFLGKKSNSVHTLMN